MLSPQGKVVELPAGATPWISPMRYYHQSVTAAAARGRRPHSTLAQPLSSGQKVEILTVKEGGPSRDWLNCTPAT